MFRKRPLYLIASLMAGLLLALAMFLFVNVQTSQAATLKVGSGGTYATIQDAIDDAIPGDTIQVRDEVFTESLVITKSLTLLGGYDASFVNRVPRTSVISPTSRGIAITGSGVVVTVDGFEIKNGNAGLDQIGGGILVDVDTGSRVVINDNFIHDNVAGEDGGGIWAEVRLRSDLQVTKNDIMSNTTNAGPDNDGAGLYMTFSMSSTLVMTRNNIVKNDSGDNYGGFYVDMNNFGHFRIEDNLIMSNTATTATGDDCGGFRFDAETYNRGSFDRNKVIGNEASDNYGGGYFGLDDNGASSFDDNEFRRNVAGKNSTGSYGGLYLDVEYGSDLTGANLILADNQADEIGGGYVDLDYGSTASLPNAKITGNEANGTQVGGIYLYVEYSKLEVPNLYVYNNRAATSYGGVYIDAGDGGETIIATGAQIISNTAVNNDGGGVYITTDDGALVDMRGSRFERNQAGGDGGGLYVDDPYYGTRILLDRTEYLTNTAGTGDGGGAYFGNGPNYGAKVSLSYARFISNTASSATSDGGGLYVDDQYYNIITGPTFIAHHAQFIRNWAGDDGGGFYLDEVYEGVWVNLDDSVYRDSYAGGDGGGLFFYECYDGCTAQVSRNTFTNNEAGGDGGALYLEYVEYGSTAYIDDNTFRGNQAGGDGGAINVDSEWAYDGSVVSFQRNTVISNTAGAYGGGLYVYDAAYEGGLLYFNDNRIENNQAADGGGGAYFDDYLAYEGGIVEMNRNRVRNNIAGGDGGGLYLDELEYGNRLQFRDNIITGNIISSTSEYDGGGLYLSEVDEGSFVWMTGNLINDNKATGDGGGLYNEATTNYGSVWYFENNQVQRNWAGDDAGGCYIATFVEGAGLQFNHNLVNNNTALEDYGGCYFSGFDDASLVGPDFLRNQFNNNTAGGDVGGLYIENANDGTAMRFWNNQIIGNRAGISGTQVTGGDVGGFWFDEIINGCEVNFWNNQILSNTAYLTGTTGGDYGAMYIMDLTEGGFLFMKDNVLAHNVAQGSHGGFHVEMYDQSRLVMEHNVIDNNTSVTDTEVVYIYGEANSDYYLRRNQIINNSAGLWLENGGGSTHPLWGISENNLIAGNTGPGVALVDTYWSGPNDTIAGNTGYAFTFTGTVTSTVSLLNDVVWGNTGGLLLDTGVAPASLVAEYSDVQGGVLPGPGNKSVNPLFVGGGDYHLQETSPAVNAADTARAPATDLEGVPRPVPVGGEADMGCYEWFLAGVTLAPDMADTVLPGTTVTYTLNITNDGNLPDTFLLDVAINPLAWLVQPVPLSVYLMPGAGTTVDFVVTVPADAMGGESNAITVRATSQSNGNVVDVAALDLAVADVADLSITPDQSAYGAPGVTLVYHHTLSNNGNFDDLVTLSANSSEGWGVIVSPAAAIVPAGDSTIVTVTVMVPSTVAGGVVDVTTVTATSSASEGTTSDTATDTTTVSQVAGVSISPDNQGTAASGTVASYTHTIVNEGNGMDTFNISAVSSQGWTVTAPAPVTLAAGDSQTIVVDITVPAGAYGLTDITTVTATSDYNSSVSASATDTTEVSGKIYLPMIFILEVPE